MTLPALADIDREYGTTIVVPRLLDAEQIVALTGLSRGTIRALVKSRRFPVPRLVGTKQLWDAREYNAWVEATPRLETHDPDAEVPRGRPRKRQR